jgi:predicted DNA-binding helix-hairpin-helix protein
MKRHTLILSLAALAVVLMLPLSALAGTTQPAASVNKQQTNPAAATSAKTNAEMSKSESAAKKPHETRWDLNSASREELMKLPGINEATAEKIIAARPFKSVSELESRKILTSTEYKSVHQHLMVKGNSTQAHSTKAQPKKAESAEYKSGSK